MTAPAQAILDFQVSQSGGLGGFGPVHDGEVIKQSAEEHVRNGTYCKAIPLMVGTCLNEATLFSIYNPAMRNLSEEGLIRHLRSAFGDAADDALAVYRSAAKELGIGDRPLDIVGAFMTDRMFRNAAIKTAELQSRHASVWMYLFDYETPAADGLLHACHSFDIPFIFGTHLIPSMRPFCGEGRDVTSLSKVMMATYAAFARNGDPNHEALPDWPTYGDDRATMRLGPDCHLEGAPLESIRALWAKL